MDIVAVVDELFLPLVRYYERLNGGDTMKWRVTAEESGGNIWRNGGEA